MMLGPWRSDNEGRRKDHFTRRNTAPNKPKYFCKYQPEIENTYRVRKSFRISALT